MGTDVHATSNLRLIASSMEFMQRDNGDADFEKRHRPIHPESVLVWPPSADCEHLGDVAVGIYEPYGERHASSWFRQRGGGSWRAVVCRAIFECAPEDLSTGKSCNLSRFLRLNGNAPRIGADAAESIGQSLTSSRGHLELFLGSSEAGDYLDAYRKDLPWHESPRRLFWQDYDNWIDALNVAKAKGMVEVCW